LALDYLKCKIEADIANGIMAKEDATKLLYQTGKEEKYSNPNAWGDYL